MLYLDEEKLWFSNQCGASVSSEEASEVFEVNGGIGPIQNTLIPVAQ